MLAGDTTNLAIFSHSSLRISDLSRTGSSFSCSSWQPLNGTLCERLVTAQPTKMLCQQFSSVSRLGSTCRTKQSQMTCLRSPNTHAIIQMCPVHLVQKHREWHNGQEVAQPQKLLRDGCQRLSRATAGHYGHLNSLGSQQPRLFVVAPPWSEQCQCSAQLC